jgi:hypothetical protein
MTISTTRSTRRVQTGSAKTATSEKATKARAPTDRDWSEAKLQRWFIGEVVLQGGAAYKLKCVGRAGFPDLLLLHPSKLVVFVEMKTLRGRLSKGQIRQHDEMRKRGAWVRTLCGKAECDEFLREFF